MADESDFFDIVPIPYPIRHILDAFPNHQDDYDNTPVHRYVLYDNFYPGTLQALIDAGNDLEIRNRDGRTGFLLAVALCNTLIIQEFIDNGANVHTRDDRNQSALHYIALPELNFSSNGEPDLAAASRKLNATFRFLEILLIRGVDVNARDCEGYSPLTMAARGNHLKIIKMLLKYGADVNSINNYSDSSLHLACRKTVLNAKVWEEPNAGIICELIRKGGEVNYFNIANLTPLLCIFRRYSLSVKRVKDYFARKFVTAACLAHWRERTGFHITRTYIHTAYTTWKKQDEDCYAEIAKMRDWQLSEASNLCQFALKGVSDEEQAIAYQVSSAALDILLRETFPIYFRYILTSFERPFLQSKLNECRISTRSKRREIVLNTNMYLEISNYLKKSELFNIIKASFL